MEKPVAVIIGKALGHPVAKVDVFITSVIFGLALTRYHWKCWKLGFKATKDANPVRSVSTADSLDILLHLTLQLSSFALIATHLAIESQIARGLAEAI